MHSIRPDIIGVTDELGLLRWTLAPLIHKWAATMVDSPATAESTRPLASVDHAGASAPTLLNLLMACGILCRVVQYLWDRSFWVDEASLVLNIRGKTAAQLLGPLDYHQAAPPLFLLAGRGMFRLLGGSEWSLRLLPLLAGCASVLVFAKVARRLLPPLAAILAVALFCFSDRSIWHATEVKQYGIDVFVAVLLTFLAVGSSTYESIPEKRLIWLAVVGAVAIWLSYPAVFVFAGLSLALLPACFRRGPRSVTVFVVANLAVFGSFLALLLTVMHAQQSQSLADYWAEDFLDLRQPISAAASVARHLLALCNYALQPVGVLVLPCMPLGVYWFVRQGRVRQSAMLLNPLALNLLAAAAFRYPFDGQRLTAYLAPAVLLLAAAGAFAIYRIGRPTVGRFALAPAVAMLAIVLGIAAFHLAVPRYRAHIRPAVKFMRAHLRLGDGIYALQLREFECYWPVDDPLVRAELDDADRIPFKRFWVIWSYPNDRAGRRLDPVRRWIQTFAAERQSFTYAGGCAYLYELTADHRPHSAPPDMSTHHKLMSDEGQKQNARQLALPGASVCSLRW